MYLSQQVSSPEWNNLPIKQTRSHTPNWCWWTLTFLFCVILGALPMVISPVKNDVFMLANKRISRVATPGHYDWSNVWSLTISCHSPWQGEDCVQFLQSTPTTYERSKCVTFGGGGRQRRIHFSGNLPLHKKLHFKCSIFRALTFPVNFPAKCFWKVIVGWVLGPGLHFRWWENPKRPAHTSRGTCNNEQINSLKPDPCLCFYDLSQSEWLGKPSQKCCPSIESPFTEVSYCFLLIKRTAVIQMWHWFIPCDFQMLATCHYQSFIDLYIRYIRTRNTRVKNGIQFGISTKVLDNTPIFPKILPFTDKDQICTSTITISEFLCFYGLT